MTLKCLPAYQKFLSTLSLRRATTGPCTDLRGLRFLSTLSLRRATCHHSLPPSAILFLSTLSLRRATRWARLRYPPSSNFYPRSPCGERHPAHVPCGPHADISIHALLAESDGHRVRIAKIDLAFLSTLSLRRATAYPDMIICTNVISIHALLAESDPPIMIRQPKPIRFLSTLSLRRATLEVLYANGPTIFLSTLSLRRATIGRV